MASQTGSESKVQISDYEVKNKKSQPESNKPIVAPAPPINDNKSSINKEQKKELQKQQRIFQQLEEKIALLNKQKNDLEKLLTDPAVYSDKNKFREAETNFANAGKELSSLNKQYEEIFEKIMQLEANQ